MRTVLLIETDLVTLMALSLTLRCSGYEVLEARNRGEAWRACNRHQGPVHLVMMSAVPDPHNSIEFLARLQHLYPLIRALFISDTSAAELADQQSTPCECALLPHPVSRLRLHRVFLSLH
jgi:response regulator RpfG family c-di-GMP phosphodiesterase